MDALETETGLTFNEQAESQDAFFLRALNNITGGSFSIYNTPWIEMLRRMANAVQGSVVYSEYTTSEVDLLEVILNGLTAGGGNSPDGNSPSGALLKLDFSDPSFEAWVLS